MGRTVYVMNTSLDLYIERAPGEQGGGEWMRIGESMHRDVNRRAANFEVAVHGRVIYEIMEPFWPAAAADESLPDFLQEYGRIWVRTPKVLVSNTRTEAGYDTRVIGGPGALDELAELRETTTGEIGVGGANVATQLLRRGLLDELVLYVHPVVLGAGRPLFDPPAEHVELDLLELVQLDDGVTMQRYAVRR